MAILAPQDILFLLCCVTVHLIYRYRRKQLLPYPPGLTRLPLVGNALSIPLGDSHIFYKELGERLGGKNSDITWLAVDTFGIGSKIMYFEALGQPIVVLNDAKFAVDLLEKRSALYSSRPRTTMISDVAKIDFLFALMPYGDEWRNHRRLFQQYFSPRALARDQERELEFIRKTLLPNLYRSPYNAREHINGCVGGLATAITYGLRIQPNHDPMVQLAEEAFEYQTKAMAPGQYLVDIIPMLRHVPEWVPGAGFQKFGRECRSCAEQVLQETYQATIKAMDDGIALDSFVSSLLERYKDQSDFSYQAQHIAETAAQIHGAAFETTATACMTFILAMLRYPDIQRAAQREIDVVVGHHRLPDFSDKPHLPYLSAILKEVLRWNPLLPLGVPHVTSGEDVYKGYYIPKGSIVFANAYAMLQDEEIFPDPKEFKPERFFNNGGISSNIPDPEVYATFGFGRRICPGSHLGLSTLYLVAVSILALFDICPELDSEGNPIEVLPEWSTGGIVSAPRPFQCKLTPREGKDIENLLGEYMDVEFV